MLFLLHALILLELHEKPGRKIELQKKVHRRICVRDITFLTARSPFYAFLLFSSSVRPLPSQVTRLRNGCYKYTCTVMSVFCVMIS